MIYIDIEIWSDVFINYDLRDGIRQSPIPYTCSGGVKSTESVYIARRLLNKIRENKRENDEYANSIA